MEEKFDKVGHLLVDLVQARQHLLVGEVGTWKSPCRARCLFFVHLFESLCLMLVWEGTELRRRAGVLQAILPASLRSRLSVPASCSAWNGGERVLESRRRS